LLETTVDGAYRCGADIDPYVDAVEAEIARSPAEKVVIVGDWRRCQLMSVDASQRAIVRLTRINEKVEKAVAIRAHDAPLSLLQMRRVVQATLHDSRKVVCDIDAAASWLADSLTKPEVDRLRQFLREAGSQAMRGGVLLDLSPTKPPKGRAPAAGKPNAEPAPRGSGAHPHDLRTCEHRGSEPRGSAAQSDRFAHGVDIPPRVR
jgi:hypothetical protein